MVSMTNVDVRDFTDLGSISVVSRERVITLATKETQKLPPTKKTMGITEF